MHNSLMPKRIIRRYLPNPRTLREYALLRPVSRWLQEPDLWHLNRRSVSLGTLVGLFCAFLPMPFQMLPAAVLAILLRCNLPVAVALVWLSNPLTMPPMMYFCYRVGAWLLDRHVEPGGVHLNWEWLSANMGNIGYPLLVGSVLCGLVAGLVGMLLVRVSWRMHVVSRWRLRREQRRLRLLLSKRDPGAQ